MDPTGKGPHEHAKALFLNLSLEMGMQLAHDMVVLSLIADHEGDAQKHDIGTDSIEAQHGNGGCLELTEAHLSDHVRLVTGDPAHEQFEPHLAVRDTRPFGGQPGQSRAPGRTGRRYTSQLDVQGGNRESDARDPNEHEHPTRFFHIPHLPGRISARLAPATDLSYRQRRFSQGHNDTEAAETQPSPGANLSIEPVRMGSFNLSDDPHTRRAACRGTRWARRERR